MAKVVDIIVLDDDDGDDEEGPSCSPEARKSPSEPPPPAPPSEPEINEKKDGGSSQNKTSMSAENQKLFEEFVEYCSKLTVEHKEVMTFLQSRFSKANVSYLSSVEFRNTLGRCLTRVQSKQSKVYVYINELCTVLKNHSEKKKVSLQTRPATPQRDKVETDNPPPLEEAEEEEEVPERKAASKHQIRRLENLLRLYSQEIQKLQEKELSLEDMADEDSSYIQESRLKQKMLRIFEKLCELKECSSLTGRVIEQRIRYKGTRYQEVNRRLEKFINKVRDTFPDYRDILQVVQKANEKNNLGLTRKHIQSIAQDAFRDLGNKLQYRRHLDMVYNFGSHLTDTYKNGLDPAEHDPSLARRLRDNRSMAETRLEDVIKKFADMQDEGEEEEWKNKDKDDELPSTSKGVKDSPRSRKTESSKSDESQEEDDEDEESEESDVDIEEELRQSQEAADGDEDEEIPVDYSNETDQKMEETSDPPSSSPAGKEDGENESDNSDQDGDEEEVEEGTDKDGEATDKDEGEATDKDGEGTDKEEGEATDKDGEVTDKEEDQDSSPGFTSLSPEKEDLNTNLKFEVEKAELSCSGDSNDSQQDNKTQEDHEEQEKSSMSSSLTSDEADSRDNSMEHLEMTVVEEDFVEVNRSNTDIVKVPYVEANMPSSKEQGTKKCPDVKIKVEKDSKSPTSRGKVGNSSRLDKCISKLTGSLSVKVATGTEEGPSAANEEEGFSHVNNKNLGSGGNSRTRKQSRKLVCVDSPTERLDSVRKVAFSHSLSADENSDVVHLDNCRNSTMSDSSNGVHRGVMRSSTPINRLKRKRDLNAPKDPVFTVTVEELGSHRRKRKTSSQLWTGNGVAKINGEENGSQQKLKRAKLSSNSYTSYSSPSEPCSDNEHDITLDLMVTCSPQMTPTKSPSPQNKTDAATQCDPDEVIVLSD